MELHVSYKMTLERKCFAAFLKEQEKNFKDARDYAKQFHLPDKRMGGRASALESESADDA